jgi:hypothetical protein
MPILKNKYLWTGIVLGLILGDIIGVRLFKSDLYGTSDRELAQTATSSPFSLLVGDQISGDTVLVLNAKVATTTWLAVRENNGDLLGRILGAHRIPPGESKDVTVELLRPTVSHLMYAIVMYEDDGDGEFDNKLDGLVEEGDQPLIYPFITVN